MVSVKLLSDILFGLDPFETCCKENDSVGEYDLFAECVVDRVESGEELKFSLQREAEVWFGVRIEEKVLNKIVELVGGEL